jgi:hypothetical protein
MISERRVQDADFFVRVGGFMFIALTPTLPVATR